MYSDKVEVLRFETEPYRKHLVQNGGVRNGGGPSLRYNNNSSNNNYNNHNAKHVMYQNGYHKPLLIDTETKPSSSSSTAAAATAITAAAAVVAASTVPSGLLNHHVQPPSDPVIASVLHPRQNPRPGRLLLENVNNRPQTMDRGTQANTDPDVDIAEAPPSTSNDPTNNELFRNANISVTNQKLLANGGDNSSVDSLNSADSAKRDNEESAIELTEHNQPMITKDDTDGHPNMSNGDGKHSGAGGKSSNGIVKEHPVDDDVDKTSCGMECLYFAMQCCECSIM